MISQTVLQRSKSLRAHGGVVLLRAQQPIAPRGLRQFLSIHRLPAHLLPNRRFGVLGGLFGVLVALVGGNEFGMPLRVAASLGLIFGLFIGAGVACLACILVTVLKSVRSGKGDGA